MSETEIEIVSCSVLSLAVFRLKSQLTELRLWIASFCLFLLSPCPASILAQTTGPNLEEYFRRAKDLELREDYSGAEKIYLEAATTYPQQPEVLKRLGLVYQTELKFAESIDTFQRVLKVAPLYPEVNFFLGLSFFGLNQFEKAIEGFNKELEINPKYRRANYYLALVYRSLNRIGDALRQYEILLQQDSTDKEALYQVVRLLKSATVTAIKQLGDLDPDSDFVLMLKAEGYADEEKYGEAIEKYQELLARNPNFPGLHFAIGQAYYKNIDYPNAEKELRLALKEDPNLPIANYYVADMLVKAHKIEEAIPLLEIVLAANPQFMMAYFQLGKSYAAQGKLTEALKPLLKAVELEPKDKMVHYQLAQLYARLKEPDKQRYHLELFQKLNVQERDTKNKQKRLSLEKALEKEKSRAN